MIVTSSGRAGTRSRTLKNSGWGECFFWGAHPEWACLDWAECAKVTPCETIPGREKRPTLGIMCSA